MFNNVWAAILAFFTAALSGLTLRNTVLVRAMGTSRLISLMDHTVNSFIFGVLLIISMELSTLIDYFLFNYLVQPLGYDLYLRPLCIVVSMSLSFLLVLFLSAKIAPSRHVKEVVEVLPSAAFNCTILGTIVLTLTTRLNLIRSLGFGLGSSVGFIAAVLLSTEAQRKLQNRDVPGAFKGMPATLLFLGALALAVYALSGYTPTGI